MPRVMLGTLTLLWAAATWAGAGTAAGVTPTAGSGPTSAILPSIEILSTQTNLAGTCGGAAFNINTFINVDTQASAQVTLSAPGFPTLEQFTDETGANIGPFNGPFPSFTILASGGGLPPNTPVRITINTYSAHALAGKLSYSSSMAYNCTTGAILNLVAADPGDPNAIPAMDAFGLAATSLLLSLAGAIALRRRASSVRRQRRPGI
jgi:hypothetical protein